MNTRRRFNAGLAALAGTATTASAWPGRAGAQTGAAPREFKVGFQKGAATLLLAKERAVFEQRLAALGVQNVRWVEFQFGPPLLEALGLGAVDIGAVGDTPPIFAQVAGAKLVYAAVSPASLNAILVPKDSPIRTVADLKGKRVAFGKGSSSHNTTVQALAKVGLTPKDIQEVHLAPADATAAFNGGRVDAWTVWDPFVAIAEQKYNARVVIDNREPHLASYSYYIANRAFAENHPAVLAAALDEIGKLIAWAGQNRTEFAAFTAKWTGLDTSALQRAYDRYHFTLGPITEQHIQAQRALAKTFFELGIVPKQVDPAEIVWKAPAP